MTKPIKIFSGSNGLNIVDPPTRLGYDDSGFVDLQVAVNVTIDQSRSVKSRKRFSLLQSGNFHSLFSIGSVGYAVKDTSLYEIQSDGSLKLIRSGLTDSLMAYAKIGERIYYTNSFELGIIYQGAHVDWIKETYYGPETHRHFDGPIPGNYLAEFFGRMIITVDNVLYYSEPYNFGLYNFAENFIQFHSKIIMIKPNETGLFLSTKNNTYFISGRNPKEWQAKKVSYYPAIERTVADEMISGSDIGLEVPGLYCLWTSQEGVILGTPNGEVVNLNKRKIIYPENAKSGFGCLIGTNYIHGVK